MKITTIKNFTNKPWQKRYRGNNEQRTRCEDKRNIVKPHTSPVTTCSCRTRIASSSLSSNLLGCDWLIQKVQLVTCKKLREQHEREIGSNHIDMKKLKGIPLNLLFYDRKMKIMRKKECSVITSLQLSWRVHFNAE